MSFLPPKETRSRLLLICRRLVGIDAPDTLAAQIQRVLARISPEERLQNITEPKDVVAAFRSKGLIPPYLTSLCHDLHKEHDEERPDEGANSEVPAVCFAACVYPQRAFRIEKTELNLRVEAFLKAYDTLKTFRAFESLSSDRIARSLPSLATYPKDNITAWLSDLSAAEILSREDAQQAQQEEEERRCGAALYLASCYTDIINRAYQNWVEEAGFLRYLRKYQTTPPSFLADHSESDESRPNWNEVLSDLDQLLPEEPLEYHERAIILEKTAWKIAVAAGVPEPLLAQSIADFWENHWDKMISGFPYYAFRSRIGLWWKQCLKWHPFPTVKSTSGVEGMGKDRAIEPGVIEQDAEDFGITPDQLRWFREGYRLVRTTFFKRQDKKSLTTGDESDHAIENESARKVLDAIWYHRFEDRMGEELPSESVQEILNRFPDLTKDRVHLLTFRVRLRIWAYALARLGKYPNSYIRSSKIPSKGRWRGKDGKSLFDEPGTQTIATLSRVAPLENTLLWAFAAHVFLHPRIEPQRPDPWTVKRFVAELWHWVNDESFDDIVHPLSQGGSRADDAAASARSTPPFDELIRDLRKVKTQAELEEYVSGREFREERDASLGILNELAGDDVLRTCADDAIILWRKRAGREGYHWIVPVWYMTVAERFDENQIVARLRAERNEAQPVRDISRAMSVRRARGNAI